MTPTPWYVSKTVILNVITTVIAILSFIPQANVVPEQYYPYILAAVGVLNIILRIWFTATAVTKPLGIGK